MDEFELIRRFFKRQDDAPFVRTGIGDDGAVLWPEPGKELVTVIDTIVDEPLGGAHRDPRAAIASVGEAIGEALKGLAGLSPAKIRGERRKKFIEMGAKGLG